MSPKITTLLSATALLGLALAGSPASGQDDDGTADASGEPDRQRMSSTTTRGQERLAQALLARERALDRRERTLGRQQKDLEVAEVAFQARIEELTAVRTELQTLLDQLEAVEEARVTKAVKMMEQMRDKSAAAMLTEMEPELAVQVLDRMKQSVAGAALAKMDPVQAADLAARLTRPITLPKGGS